MIIEIEVPDKVKDCKNHSFPASTLTCECGLHINLLPFLAGEKKKD